MENERKLKARAKELQDELDYTLKRIEQLQRGGAFTPVRRRTPSVGSNSKPSPYNRNTSGGAKKPLGVSPQGSATRSGSNPYTRPGLSGQRTGVPSTTNITNQNRISPNTRQPIVPRQPPPPVAARAPLRQSPGANRPSQQ